MWAHLERGSSPVDWCESNYSISPVIAEFVNTISNFLFFLFPPVLIHLFQEYARRVNPGINVLWVMLMVVGLSSAYFHATLSLVGQLLDELAILWLFMASFTMFFPKRHFPKFLNGNRKKLMFFSSVFSLVSTGFLIMAPAANAFALMTMALPAIGFLYKELSRSKCPRVYRLGLRCVAVSLLAMFCWVLDRLFCDAWLSIDFPYMHGVWHILIFIASYTAVVLCAYFNVLDERPEQKPQLRKKLMFFSSVFSLVSTGFLIMAPAANAFALMTMALPAIGFLYKELSRSKCPRVYRLGLRCVAVSLLAMFCWVLDRLFCDAWLSIDFPYMHGVWHILIFIASYTAVVLCAYFNVLDERPEQKPQLRYWPRNHFEFGIPYVTVKHPCQKHDMAI